MQGNIPMILSRFCRTFPIVLWLPLAIVLLPQCSRRPDSPPPLDCILISIDTVRQDRIGIYNARFNNSPFIDGLARSGFMFRRAVAPSSWTKPAIASLLTGLYPSRHGAVGEPGFLQELSSLDKSNITLAEVFREAGYRTCAFINNPHLDSIYHFDQGFEDFTQTSGDAKELLENALRWIDQEQMKGKRPFFLYIHILDPHYPYSPPAPFLSKTDPIPQAPFTEAGSPQGLKLWWTDFQRWVKSGRAGQYRFDYEYWFDKLNDKGAVPGEWTLEKFQDELFLDFQGLNDLDLLERKARLIAGYHGELAYTDRELERFVEHLEERGLTDRTALVLTADHGESFFEHDTWGHGQHVHRELIDIPLIFRIPEGEKSRRGYCDDFVSLVDVFPTLADLLNLPPPPPGWRGNRSCRS